LGNGSRPVKLGFLTVLTDFFDRIKKTLGPMWQMASAFLAIFFPKKKGKVRIRPWMIVRRGKGKAADQEATPDEADVRRLLERIHDLDDASLLSDRAVGFAGVGADFFAKPRDIEEMVESLVRQNPPFLHIARECPDDADGESRHYETEYLLRETEVVVTEPYLLFVPQTGSEHRENRRPPGYPILRAAKTLSDLRAAPLLYQALPEDLLIARLLEGSVPVLAYREERKYLLFRPEEHMVEHRERRQNHVPVEIETGGAGQSARLMYMLFDRSTSLVHNCAPRGVNAVMELAIAVAMLRADMGRPHARYYFRAFAERMDPLAKDPPLSASSVTEKDNLVRRLFETNFSGEATRIVDALETAADDIERIVESGELGPNVKPRIGLLTDGRSSLYGSIGTRLKRLGIELDTVLIGREASHNPELMRASSTISLVDPALFRAVKVA
jgi:hypothetical protein